MKHLGVQFFSESDWLGPDPHPAPTYECDFCGDREVESDRIRDYVRDVDGQQGLICIRCIKHGVLDLYTPRGS